MKTEKTAGERLDDKTQLEGLAHRMSCAMDRHGASVADYFRGDILVRESWHPTIRKYILTVDGAVSREEAALLVAEVLAGFPLSPPDPPSPPPCATPSDASPASQGSSGPTERRS